MKRKRFSCPQAAGTLACLAALAMGFESTAAERPNVLFIAVDDLRPQLSCMGRSFMKTPNIDRLATGGTAFTRAYCQAPQCGPSRASVLTGLRPTRNRFFRNDANQPGGFKNTDRPGIITLPGLFKQNGYTTLSLGKVYHHHTSDLKSWSEHPWKIRPESHEWSKIPETWQSGKGKAALTKKKNKWTGLSNEYADVADNAYPDGKMAEEAIRRLKQLKKEGKPFFLATGFIRPHLPFTAPKKYWDMYSDNDVKLADNPFRPQGAPEIAFHDWPELRAYTDIPAKGPLSEKKAKELIHAYYACVSYTDAQVGKLLDTLDESGLADNTIVVLWGDHGWNLGEHGLWCKHSVFETSLRAPLIIRAPGFPAGQEADALVEFVDMYPTLADLCGLAAPEHLQGSSLKPLLQDKNAPWKQAVFSRWKWGESIRTERYRYTEWYNGTGKTIERMLFDHKNDPNENRDIANDPEMKTAQVRLSKTLNKGEGWQNIQQ